MIWNTSSDATLAVDLGIEAVRVIQLQSRKGLLRMDFFAEQGVAEGPLANLPERQLGALRDLLALQRVRTRRVIAALPTCLVLTRTVLLDKSKGESAEDQILWALSNCLPFDSADLMFDYWKVGETVGPGGVRSPEVMVAATQASVVDKYLAGFEKLHLRCAHLDVAPCAIATLLSRTSTHKDAPVGTITLTRNHGFFAIAERGQVLFWRPFELSAGSGGGAAGMAASLERIGEEVSKCVSHMVGTMHIENLSEMVLFGHGSDELVVNEYLKNRFHLPVRNVSPFDALPAESLPSALREAASATATHYCTALGLALQTAGGMVHG